MPFRDVIGHDRAKSLLQAALLHERVAHAYLFHGERGIGKRLTALRFAQAINCETVPAAEADSCSLCRSCLQIEARTHPDLLIIEPDAEQANPQIKIEQIRDIEQHVMYRPLVGSRKVCIIDDADRLTIGAANALLKTLEEPPDHSLFLLVSSRPFALPATIRSRCQLLRFASPARMQVEAALILRRELPPADARFLAVLCEGRIGEALQLDVHSARETQGELSRLMSAPMLQSASSVLAAAETLAKQEHPAGTLAWLRRWLRDVLLVRVGGEDDSLLNIERLPALRTLADRLSAEILVELLTELESLEQQANRNLNLQLALETIFLRLREAYAGSQADAATARPVT